MEKPFILHMLTTAKNLSPFDVNMAMDAGWVCTVPYTNVEPSEVRGLVQDAIFSRSPKGLQKTGIFIGGRDTKQAMDMLKLAKTQWYLLLKYRFLLILAAPLLRQPAWLPPLKTN